MTLNVTRRMMGCGVYAEHSFPLEQSWECRITYASHAIKDPHIFNMRLIQSNEYARSLFESMLTLRDFTYLITKENANNYILHTSIAEFYVRHV